MIVISPHLDDAVFSCGALLAHNPGATIATICAGRPGPDVAPSQFDRAAGFSTAAAAMTTRRAEDTTAAARLGVRTQHFDCLEVMYSAGQPVAAAVAQALEAAEPDEAVFGPLGLRHPDHEVVAAAFRSVVRARGLKAWVYEDLPYAALWPEHIDPALKIARCEGARLTVDCTDEKGAAVQCYASQLHGMEPAALLSPERYHRLNGELTL